jgi:hypothetical protein
MSAVYIVKCDLCEFEETTGNISMPTIQIRNEKGQAILHGNVCPSCFQKEPIFKKMLDSYRKNTVPSNS